MKLFCFSLLLFLQFSAEAQVNYAPVFIEQCSGRIVKGFYEISDLDGNHFSDPYSLEFEGEFSLPKQGEYTLTADWEPPIYVNIVSDNQADTFYTMNLEIPVCVCSPPPTKYQFCSENAEGYCVDYYKPGVIRREGTFKNGDPIDTVKTYYLTGELMEIDVRTKKSKKSVDYYRNGQKKREFEHSKGFVDRTYFSNGQVEIESVYRNHKRTEKEYFENGQLKRKERERKGIRYSETGLKVLVTRRKAMFPWYRMSPRDYRLILKKYDEEGDTKLKVKFLRSDNLSSDYPQNLSEIDIQEIEELLIYQNGKPRQKFVQTFKYVDSKRTYEVVNFSREKQKWVEVSKHDSEIFTFLIKRFN